MTDEPNLPLPVEEKQQPDPMLQISTGRIGGGGLALFAIAAIVILCVVFYGLSNGVDRSGSQHPAATATNSAPAPAPGKANPNG